MKIDQFGNISEAAPAKKRPGVARSGVFSSLLSLAESDESSQVGKAGNVVATSDISSIIALQEISEEEVRRKKAIKRGDAMLDSLEQLRRGLLTGTIPTHMLHDINKQLAADKETTTDPHLLAIIADIELRTAVELAKLEMAVASRSKIDGI